MKITSTKQAKEVLKVGMYINAMTDYERKVLAVNENEVECIDVAYNEDTQDYEEVGKSYFCTYTDFVGSYIE